MKRLPVLAAVVLLTVAGCGGGAEDDASAPSAAATTSAAASEPAPEATGEEGSPAAESAGGEVLTGTVGEEGDPDAFVITLTDSSGTEITELPAGDYTIEVNDPSTIHNFHLVGDGVDETTTVPEVTTVTWNVTLTAGSYRITCDPHPNMVAEITVT